MRRMGLQSAEPSDAQAEKRAQSTKATDMTCIDCEASAACKKLCHAEHPRGLHRPVNAPEQRSHKLLCLICQRESRTHHYNVLRTRDLYEALQCSRAAKESTAAVALWQQHQRP